MRILIVRLGAIGDVVHTLPALARLRGALPEAHLTWAVERGGGAKLLKGNPCLDDLIELDMRGWRKRFGQPATWGDIAASVRRLRNGRFDLSLDFQGLFKSAMIPWLAGVPRRIGFEKSALREPASAFLLTEGVAVDDNDHIIKKNLQLIASIGIQTDEPEARGYEFPIGIDKEDLDFAGEINRRYKGSYAILNPGGGWPTKLWAPREFAEIAGRLWRNFGIHSLVTYGPGEENLASEVESQAPSATMIDSTLKQFFALSKGAKLFIGGDTGPMHLAAAAGAPIVAIFGPTSARRNGPFREDDVVIERFDLDCRTDCYRRSCSHTSCMKIPAETVWQGVVRRLEIAKQVEERRSFSIETI